ncbi:MAG: YlmC/YmxH family sporulation protein [Candidatus Syntrophonatronum acetioxidans]|uniref:YlmC/YmxH family sporulation protein n=1 Tax=Candidatus Syntrophonatronum acetioxidans TaxID=1795816 RepID=A0A424YE31_9FIRM|nr:MAG: YlmC/YmxH family sporulation protein [Candidatus Syntrophonatronum acetioxidans]
MEGKEIINLYDGSRLGVLGNAELLFDPETGYIEALILPSSNRFLNFSINREEISIPWNSIHRIGTDMMLVELRVDGKRIKSWQD